MTLTREEAIEVVSRPGKFEGEPPYVPYFWVLGLDGMADDWDEGDGSWGFLVQAEDVRVFPELAAHLGEMLWLRECDDGFVGARFGRASWNHSSMKCP